MRVSQLSVNLRVPEMAAAREFYTEYLGLSVEEFTLGWVSRLTSPDAVAPVSVQLLTRDATAPVDPAISVKVDDVDAALAEARRRGYRILHPLTQEEWGVLRFFVQAPDGTVVNIVQEHGDAGDMSPTLRPRD